MEEYKVEGLQELEQAMKDLPVKIQASIYRAINRKAVKKYVVDNIRNAVNYSAKTERGINIINDRSDKTAVYGGVTSDSFFLRFSDRGTASRQTRKGANRGSIQGRQEIQPIIMSSVEDIIKYANTEIGDEMIKFLEKRIKSVQKKIAKLG